ncbi:hypothetical protein HaLaN_08951, partial [Haematococcus lacustris]
MSKHATKSADLHRCLAVVRISIKPTAAQGSSKQEMPVNHPHLKNPAARNEPNTKRCALCELTSPAKSRNGFVTVERLGEDACHGRYLIVFGRASVLMGCV